MSGNLLAWADAIEKKAGAEKLMKDIVESGKTQDLITKLTNYVDTKLIMQYLDKYTHGYYGMAEGALAGGLGGAGIGAHIAGALKNS